MVATASILLDTAQELIQTRGFNAFSFRDLAHAADIKTASVHYHFPTKGDLVLALMERYSARLQSSLAEIDGRCRTSKSRLERFIDHYRDTGARGVACLCGSLATDMETLPSPVQDAVRTYLDDSEAWVRATIDAGRKSGEFRPTGRSADLAAALVTGLQGALLLGRARREANLGPVARGFFVALGTA